MDWKYYIKFKCLITENIRIIIKNILNSQDIKDGNSYKISINFIFYNYANPYIFKKNLKKQNNGQ